MLTVAIIGPDGAGKTTISRQLERTLPVRVKYLYMGVNLQTSNLVLPTTWLFLTLRRLRGMRPDMTGPRDPARSRPRPAGRLRGAAFAVKQSLRLANQIGEEWFHQAVAGYYRLRGYIVLSDRDFFADYYAYDVANSDPRRPLTSRIHGFMLRHFYRRPDLVILLDASPETMFARKGEATLELLQQRRQEYLQLQHAVRHFEVVDASGPLDEVAREVRDRICRLSLSSENHLAVAPRSS